MAEETIIMYDSCDAAEPVQTPAGTLWRGRNTQFWTLDESIARYAGCTHRTCRDCGQPTVKHWLICEACRQERSDKKFSGMIVQEWDGVTPLVLYDDDRYFFSWDDIVDYCDDLKDTFPTDLRLVICEPVYGRELTAEYWDEQLPGEEQELPAPLQAFVDQLNAAVRAHGPLSWREGKIAADVTKFLESDAKAPDVVGAS